MVNFLKGYSKKFFIKVKMKHFFDLCKPNFPLMCHSDKNSEQIQIEYFLDEKSNGITAIVLESTNSEVDYQPSKDKIED